MRSRSKHCAAAYRGKFDNNVNTRTIYSTLSLFLEKTYSTKTETHVVPNMGSLPGAQQVAPTWCPTCGAYLVAKQCRFNLLGLTCIAIFTLYLSLIAFRLKKCLMIWQNELISFIQYGCMKQNSCKSLVPNICVWEQQGCAHVWLSLYPNSAQE